MSARAGSVALVVAAMLPTMLPIGGAAAAPRAIARGEAPADRPSKPTGPITVEYRLAAAPVFGVPLDVVVTAWALGYEAHLSLTAVASELAAVLIGAPQLVEITGGRYTWDLTVVPLASDAGYLNLLVAGVLDGVAQARSVAIPVRDSAAGARLAPATPPATETLIALPVQERP